MVTIDGVPFTPVDGAHYSHDYVAIARDIACGKRVARRAPSKRHSPYPYEHLTASKSSRFPGIPTWHTCTSDQEGRHGVPVPGPDLRSGSPGWRSTPDRFASSPW